jgi:peptide chain release factor 1
MLDKLKSIEEKFEQINQKLCDPNVVSDIEQYKKLMQELKQLTPVVEKYRVHKAALASFDEARMLLEEGGLDKDFRDMVFDEMEAAKITIEKTQEELKILLLPRDPNDDRNVIVEIRGGAGGEEASLFAGTLFRMYSMYAESKGWKSEILNANETELGGFKEIVFMIEGEGAYSALNLKAVSTVFSVCPKPKAKAGFTPQLSPLRFYRRLRRLILKLTRRFTDRYLPLKRRGWPAYQ